MVRKLTSIALCSLSLSQCKNPKIWNLKHEMFFARNLLFLHGARLFQKRTLLNFDRKRNGENMTLSCWKLWQLWPATIYLWRSKVVCFVLYLWDPANQDASARVLGLFGKFSRRRGKSDWFHGVWTCGVEVLEYWIICSLKIKYI